MRIAVLNGPNLNLLGRREPAVYGSATLEEIERSVRARAEERGVGIDWCQTNAEGDFVDLIHRLPGLADGAIINAAAYTHTSIAIRDAMLAVNIPFVEAHLSNVFKREAMRHKSLLADLAVGVVAGFGATSYLLALEGLIRYLSDRGR